MGKIKIRILGAHQVGKSSLIRSFQDGKNIKHGAYVKNEGLITNSVILGGEQWSFSLFESARNSTKAPKQCDSGTPIILCYSTIDKESLDWAREWLKKNSEHIKISKTPIILVATQTNLTAKRVDDIIEEGKQLAEEFNIPFMQTNDHLKTIGDVFLKIANIKNRFSCVSLNDYPITQKLEAYVARINSYTNYTHGFWFMKESRAGNRAANCYLATELLKQINEAPLGFDLRLLFTPEHIKSLRDSIIKAPREGEKSISQWSSFKDHGINSSELNKILQDIRKDLGLKDVAPQVPEKGSEFLLEKPHKQEEL